MKKVAKIINVIVIVTALLRRGIMGKLGCLWWRLPGVQHSHFIFEGNGIFFPAVQAFYSFASYQMSTFDTSSFQSQIVLGNSQNKGKKLTNQIK